MNYIPNTITFIFIINITTTNKIQKNKIITI